MRAAATNNKLFRRLELEKKAAGTNLAVSGAGKERPQRCIVCIRPKAAAVEITMVKHGSCPYPAQLAATRVM